MAEPVAIREDISVLSTEALAKRCFQIATGPYRADQTAMAYLAEFGRRLTALENDAAAHRAVCEQVARCWTSSEVEASGSEPEPDDATETLNHLIHRARTATGIGAPVIEAEEVA